MKKLFRSRMLVSAVLFFCTSCGFAAMKIQARQSEAKVNLWSIGTVEISYFSEYNEWGSTFKTIGWEVQGENRYAYFLNSCEEVIPAANGFKECPADVREYFDRCHKIQEAIRKIENASEFFPMQFCTAAVANLDKDDRLDIWVMDNDKVSVQYSTDVLD